MESFGYTDGLRRAYIKIGAGTLLIALALIQTPKLKVVGMGDYEMGQWLGIMALLVIGLVSLYSGWKAHRVNP